MTTFQFTKSGSPALDVKYKTDLIPSVGQSNFTVLEVEGLSFDEQYLHGIDFRLLAYSVPEFIAHAVTNSMTLKMLTANNDSDILVLNGVIKPELLVQLQLTYNSTTKVLSFGSIATSPATIPSTGSFTSLVVTGYKNNVSTFPTNIFNITNFNAQVAVTCTFTGSSANITTATQTTPLKAGDKVQFSNSGGALPTSVTAGVDYYVIATGLSTTNIQVSTTPGGAAITHNGAGTGTHTVTRVLAADYTTQTANVSNVEQTDNLSGLAVVFYDGIAGDPSFTYPVKINVTTV